MKRKYSDWIAKNYPTEESAKNKCNEAVVKMKREFPELELCVGKVKFTFHCWLMDGSGNIVDPTAHQFKDLKYNDYKLIANRFLMKHEIESSTGVVFLDEAIS